MSEIPTTLGPDGQLIAVVSEPEKKRSSAPTVLLLNAGLIHRVGPNRLNVVLARKLAELGFRSVRFDLSGIGDSDRSRTDRPYQEQAVFDIREVIAELSEERPSEQFVLFGLCTGAYNAQGAAVEEEQVAGCVLIDGYVYTTRKSQIRYQTKRLLQGWRWKRYIKRKLGMDNKAQIRNPYDEMVFQPEEMPKDQFASDVEGLIGRGTSLHFVYTGYGPQPYNYEDQLFDAFPGISRDSVTLLYLPDATHTFTSRAHRDRLVESVLNWMESNFPDHGAADPMSASEGVD